MSSNNPGGPTALGKLAIAAVIAILAGGGVIVAKKFGAFDRPVKEVAVPEGLKPIGGTVGAAPAATQQPIAAFMHGGKPVTTGCKVTTLTIAWNATMPIHLANGGAVTAEGSLFAKQGVRIALERQDDYGKMQEQQIKFAEAVKKGDACPSDGAGFVIIMGDGYPAYAAGIDDAMKKLGQGVQAIYGMGYSFGEDKCMLPAGFDKNPQLARGSLIGAVMRDGDYNICVTWAAQNGIPINPDEKTYDPNAMNFRAVSAFTEADEGIIKGYKEKRPVIVSGKRTGEVREVEQNGTATWTPGDVNVAKSVGGFVSVASTREYSFQMPALLIGNRDFMKRNPNVVKGMIRALAQAGAEIKGSDAALRRAAEIETLVYKEQDPDYWVKYAKGTVEPDKKGIMVALGGSRVNTIADNAFLFGLGGNDNLFKRIYTQFGDHNVRYYKEVMASYPKYEDVVDTTYLAAVLAETPAAQAAAPTAPVVYSQERPMERIVAKRNWSIEFDTGKATIRPESVPVLEEMLNQIAITSLQVEVRGHTDSVGNPTANLALSRARAEAVKAFLMANARSGFPESRVSTKGYGDTAPIGDNSTPDGKQKNRRVEIILGTTG